MRRIKKVLGLLATIMCFCCVVGACGSDGKSESSIHHTHTEEVVKGKAATCEETGLTDGKKCSVCGETLVEQEIIPLSEQHTEEVVKGKTATCEETGLTDGKVCTVCGDTLVEQEEIPLSDNHDYEEGVCSVCGGEDPDYVFTYSIKVTNVKYGPKTALYGTATADETAEEGNDVPVTLKAESGCYLESFSVDGKDCMKDIVNNVYTIKNIQANVEIEVKFAPSVVYATQKPVIDGQIDDDWANASKLYTDNRYISGTGALQPQSHGYVSIMWDEEYLYFLAVVTDRDVCEMDCVNLWIAETYIESDQSIAYTPALSDGRYYVVSNPDGVYKPCEEYWNDKNYYGGSYEIATNKISNAVGMATGYVVEVKMKKQTAGEYEQGHAIGFDVSIDTWFTGETERYDYCNWMGVGHYWSDAAGLGKLILKKF